MNATLNTGNVKKAWGSSAPDPVANVVPVQSTQQHVENHYKGTSNINNVAPKKEETTKTSAANTALGNALFAGVYSEPEEEVVKKEEPAPVVVAVPEPAPMMDLLDMGGPPK